jgi:DedD protein
MDQGLKERLVGAAVLVAIGVWLIPWVLDGPDQPVDPSTSSLELPAAEEPMPMRSQTLRLDGEDASGAPAGEAALSPPPPDPEKSVAAAPARSAAKPPQPVVPKPEAAKTEPPKAEPPKTAAATAPRSSAPPPAAKGDWAVQLGVFGEEDNARRLAARAAALGHRASVARYSSGGRDLFRVRVGPLETRARAEATASALSAHGLTAQVVAAAD